MSERRIINYSESSMTKKLMFHPPQGLADILHADDILGVANPRNVNVYANTTEL